MTERTNFVLTLLALLGAGLVAGVFLAFSTFIMRALAMMPPAQGMLAMQNINVTVITPIFMAVLFGTALIAAYLGFVAFRAGPGGSGSMVMVASACYIFGVIGVTMAFNVPLNDGLAAAQPTASGSEIQWATYVSSWTWWNHVRCAFSLFSAVAFALVLRGL